MPAFELFQPASVADALGVLERHGADAWVMAGGLDTFDWLKDRIKKPDGGRRPRAASTELRGIKEADGGLEIGAMTTLTEIAQPRDGQGAVPAAGRGGAASSPRRRFATRARSAATSSQDARCWYYRAGWPCYRAGGNICYADTPTAINREHAIFDADRCVAVNPSDTAPALIALDAQMVDQQRRRRARRAGARSSSSARGIDITG